MKKLNNDKMAAAFAEVEYMDYLIVSVLFSEPVDASDVWWERDNRPLPPVAFNVQLSQWEEGLIMVLVGLRSDSTIAVRFRMRDDGSWECLVPKEERDKICRRSMGQAAMRLAGVQ